MWCDLPSPPLFAGHYVMTLFRPLHCDNTSLLTFSSLPPITRSYTVRLLRRPNNVYFLVSITHPCEGERFEEKTSAGKNHKCTFFFRNYNNAYSTVPIFTTQVYRGSIECTVKTASVPTRQVAMKQSLPHPPCPASHNHHPFPTTNMTQVEK